ncbi:MAG TPA: hypothetical protein PLB74_00905 [Candidatus Paceibacterota bacterium]|nr:hypothetical protein [Candidatus Paceibacterota bacterium]HOK20624.1 hypothetical protein [Candidatus Paceibacterota bacterium]HOL54026.1 hypothetical protein [Candidatus Paceibacterota bacterium]HON21776.1 hypothetical protein [Candidatus Paceibacterota bacterium]HOV88610.1 hypothetical protein [Candidatus Paceibacterota bacterium]
MRQKSFYLIIIIILVALLAFVIYAYVSDYQKAKENLADRVLSAHLESFPVGTAVKEGMKGTEKSVFKKGEWMGVSGTIKTTEGGTLSLKIFDLNNNLVKEDPKWEETIQGGQGSFGMCCIVVPNEIGQYEARLLLNDNPIYSLTFSVTE